MSKTLIITGSPSTKQLVLKEDGSLELDADLAGKLDATIGAFRKGLHRAAHEVPVH